ncbi:hypothetical protein Poli38472_008247 [Pythium oligandrum]|uniref:Fatty acyl-CoA reductase C-terminal domain-containing protein n=1 Tax=Pythium oligandrum TaxID=41045 RepID=A0A8K1CLS4_PYTOL|nr:hypothetical protein Poli38472_008247 [Pythium oligandrum]|eukprot:TMW65605.1 hypothetical protein Poli38472_008247 [Pythium oligandrum]
MPGWIDQIAGAGAIFLVMGSGVLTMARGNPEHVADIVPVDLAVNNLLVSVAAKAKQVPVPRPFIVHGGTSDPRQNPLRWRSSIRVVVDYFRKYPPAERVSMSKFNMIPSKEEFKTQWLLSYVFPSVAMSTLGKALADEQLIRQAERLRSISRRAKSLVKCLGPFGEREWIFHADSNDVLASLLKSNDEEWWVDAKDIDWERYILNYCVGLKKYMLNEDVSTEDHRLSTLAVSRL